MIKNYENLTNTIVIQAATDYEKALRTFDKIRDKKSKVYYQALKTKSECEKFFRLRWFKQLCDLDGEKLIKDLQTAATVKKIRRQKHEIIRNSTCVSKS